MQADVPHGVYQLFSLLTRAVAFEALDRVNVAGLSSWKPLEKLPPVMSAEMVLYVLFMMDNDSQTPWPAGPTYVQREKGTFVVIFYFWH